MNSGHQLAGEGQHEKTLTHCLKAIEAAPYPERSRCLADVYRQLDRDTDALPAYVHYVLGIGVSAEGVNDLRETHTQGGWTAYWKKWLEVSDRIPDKYYRWHGRAQIYDRLKQTNDVIASLKKSIENREIYATCIRNPTSWKPYRSYPDFPEPLRMLCMNETGQSRVD